MIRLFGIDCIDISETNGDGWLVTQNLIASMSNEQSHMADTAIIWALRQKQSEILVVFDATTLWHGVHTTRRARVTNSEKAERGATSPIKLISAQR